MNSYLIPLLKIEEMSSLEIAELTGKKHAHVLRDIRNMLEELYQKDDPKTDDIDIKGVLVVKDGRNYIKEIKLDYSHTQTLVTGYSTTLRKKVIDRWLYLEEQLRILKDTRESKKHQLDAMEALSHLLVAKDAINYIKANVVINKAVSNLFGFSKMLKKSEMSSDMLSVREKVTDDYIKLFEVFESSSKVKELVYEKYQPKRIGFYGDFL